MKLKIILVMIIVCAFGLSGCDTGEKRLLKSVKTLKVYPDSDKPVEHSAAVYSKFEIKFYPTKEDPYYLIVFSEPISILGEPDISTKYLYKISDENLPEDSFEDLGIGFFIENITPISVLGILVAFFAHNFWKIRERKREIKILKGSFEDAQRHCQANLDVLFEIRSTGFENGAPSIVHFRKLLIPEDSPFFLEGVYQRIEDKKVRGVHNLKAKARNINIEIKTMIEYLEKDLLNKNEMNEYLEYLIIKNHYIMRVFSYVTDKISGRWDGGISLKIEQNIDAIKKNYKKEMVEFEQAEAEKLKIFYLSPVQKNNLHWNTKCPFLDELTNNKLIIEIKKPDPDSA